MAQFSPILNILETQLLPWILQNGMTRFIVAHSRMKGMPRMPGIDILPKKLKGSRKGVRAYSFSNVSAFWHEDRLLETHAPMLNFVIKGQADLNCGDYIIKLPEGYGLFVPGDVPRWTGSTTLHHLEDNPQRFSETIHFVENSGSLHVWLGHQHGNHHYGSGLNEVLMVQDVRLLRLLEEMQQEIVTPRANNTKICRRLLEIFLFTLQRDLQEDKFVHPGKLASNEIQQTTFSDPIQQAQQYIREHLHEGLTQDKVARVVYLSRTQFIRRFREETGQTFNQFVTSCRLEQAKTLLQTTNFPLTFISSTLGYQSPVYFNTLFRKQVGMLPSEFRAQKQTVKACA